MDVLHSTHPTAESLRAYSLGRLDEASAEAVGRHLEQCPECRRLVAEMAPDTFLDRLRGVQAGAEMSESSAEIPAEVQTDRGQSNVAQEATGNPNAACPTSPSESTAGLRPTPSGPQPEATLKDDPTLDHASNRTSPVVSDSEQTGAQESSTGAGLEPGTRVRYFGDYELQKVLGEGGMGVVYMAKQLSLNRLVALKMIKATRFASSDELRRFQNEAEAVARLDHPNIVPIFEVGQFEDQHYFSMKLIGGESLDKRLKDYATDFKGAATLVATAASAILHAHQRGILHRDLKPANILIDAEGQPHVTDFGLAKRVEGDSELTRSGAILGTPAYMAPEQASGRRGSVTTSTDVYGLGAILYALLTGRAPFGGTTVMDTLEQVRERPPESPRKLNPRVPRDLEVVCLKCLEKDPRRRYASADALAEDLSRWLAGEPIAARPVGRTVRLGMWCRRNPVVAVATGLVATALVVVAALSLLYARKQTQLADERNKRLTEQLEATTKIDKLNKSLAKEGSDLKAALSDSNRRLAMLFFERAQRALDSGQVNHGLLWLVECWRYAAKADDRAWQYLARANLSLWRYNCPEIKGIFSPGTEVSQVAFSPNGKTALAVGHDNTVRLWDASTLQQVGKPLVHQDFVEAVAFSPDSKIILTGSRDRTARLWNAVTGQPIGRPLEHSHWVEAVAFSPDGKTALTGSIDYTARLWDTTTSQPIGQPMVHQNRVRSVAYSPDGKTVLTRSLDSTARLWDAATGRPLGQPMVHQGGVISAAYSPDGKTILTWGSDKTARRWDTATGHPLGQPMAHQDRASSVAYSPDGKTVLTTALRNNTARLWDAVTGQPIGKPLEHQSEIMAVAYSPDGKMVLTGSVDNTARLWDAATGRPLGQPMVHLGGVRSVAYSPDGGTILTASGDGTVRLWDTPIGRPLGQPLQHQGFVGSVAYSSDGKRILTFDPRGSNAGRAWDAATGQPLGPPLRYHSLVTHVTCSADGKTLLTGSRDHTARLWDVATGQPRSRPMTHQGWVVSLAFSPDGKFVVTGSFDKTARLWDAATAQPVGQPLVHQGSVNSVAFSPDSKTVLTGSSDRMARLWDAATGRSIGQVLQHQRGVFSVAYSPDGKTVLTGGGDKTARLWNVATGSPIGEPLVHQSVVDTVTFNTDGKTIITTSRDGTARLWDAVTGRPLSAPLVPPPGAGAVSYSPDGKTILAWGGEKMARLWDAATGQPIGPPLEQEGGNPRVGHPLAFSPDGRSIVTASDRNPLRSDPSTARLWHLPPLVYEDLSHVEDWVETITALAVDDQGNIKALDSDAWQERREQLRQLGGPPKRDPAWLFDPILYGPDPTARARAWLERKQWAEAEAAFAEVLHARPLHAAAWAERGRLFVTLSDPAKGADDFVQALALGHQDPKLLAEIVADEALFDRVLTLALKRSAEVSGLLLLRRAVQLAEQRQWDRASADFQKAAGLVPLDRWSSYEQVVTFLTAGDRDALRRAVAELLNRFQTTAEPVTANSVAWTCALASDAVEDHEAPVHLAEVALNGWTDVDRHQVLNTLAATLFRAGRFEDAIRRLEEKFRIRLNGRLGEPQDWAFLAMAHFRLGHRDEAHRWLDRLRNRQTTTDPNQFWDELEIRLLRSEAEAVILYDPVFPADPFAH